MSPQSCSGGTDEPNGQHRAEVERAPWDPQFEITQRRLVAPADVIAHLAAADALARIVSRALHAASLLSSR